MAADFIGVDRSKALGSQLVIAANQLLATANLISQLNAIGQHCFAASDFSVFEAKFGLAAGTGSNVLTLLGLINNNLNTNTEIVGATRLANIQEFIARISGQ